MNGRVLVVGCLLLAAWLPSAAAQEAAPVVVASAHGVLAADIGALIDRIEEVTAECRLGPASESRFTREPTQGTFRFSESILATDCAEMLWLPEIPDGAEKATLTFEMDRIVDDQADGAPGSAGIVQQLRLHGAHTHVALDLFEDDAPVALLQPFAIELSFEEGLKGLGWFFHDEGALSVDADFRQPLGVSGREFSSTVAAPTLTFPALPVTIGLGEEVARTQYDDEFVIDWRMPVRVAPGPPGLQLTVEVDVGAAYEVVDVLDEAGHSVPARVESKPTGGGATVTWALGAEGGAVDLVIASRAAVPPAPPAAPPADVAWLAYGIAVAPLAPLGWAATTAERNRRAAMLRSPGRWWLVVGALVLLYAATFLQAWFLLGEATWTALPLSASTILIHTQFGGLFLAMVVVGALGGRSMARAQRARLRHALVDEERMRSVLESAPDAMLVVDTKGRVTSVNQKAEELFGVAREELKKRSIEDLLEADAAAPGTVLADFFAPRPGKALASGNAVKAVCADGAKVPVDVNLSPLATDEGRAVVASIRDVTEALNARVERENTLQELATANRELEKLIDELARSNEDLERFATVASHDLQEPLRKVTSYVTLLENRYRDQIDDRGLTYIEFAADGARRMQRLIRDVLAFSRVGRTEVPIQQVDLSAAVREIIQDRQEAIAEMAAVVEVGPMPTIDGRPVEIQLLFQNLIANALKFRDPDRPTRVNIYAERVGEGWHFTVEDNGIGIDPDHQDRIFGIFQRLHPRARYEGTGVGLAICRRIAEDHGGSIRVESALGEGSAFCVRWPDAAR